MVACPFCQGFGFYASHADGAGDDDCYLCHGTGQVFDGMRKIRRRFFRGYYVIACPKCGQDNSHSRTSCENCGHKFT